MLLFKGFLLFGIVQLKCNIRKFANEKLVERHVYKQSNFIFSLSPIIKTIRLKILSK